MNWPIVRKAARRFIAGETIDDAIAMIRDLNAQGITATLDHLGENVETRDDAIRRRRLYWVLDAIGATGVKSHVSVKLPRWARSGRFCRENVARILAKAKEVGTRVRIDMESTEYTDRTLAIYRRLRQDFDNVGIVIQAYLYRSEADIAALCEEGAHVRLCKGAYKEPPAKAFPRRPMSMLITCV
ncbi:MAG: proline dehydrogenase family protein [Anaerolineae bacterium]